MARDDHGSRGFAATLRAAAEFEDPLEVVALVGTALAERGSVPGQALRFLLDRRGLVPMEIIIRGFHHLGAAERAETMDRRVTLLRAASVVLADSDPAGRRGLAAFVATLPPHEALAFLLPLVDDPSESVRRVARGALLRASREHLTGQWDFSGPVEIRQYVWGLETALRNPIAADFETHIPAMISAAGDSDEGRSALRTILGDEHHPVRTSVVEALQTSGSPAVAVILLFLISGPPSVARESAVTILRSRHDPEFLCSLATVAAERMESPAGIPAPAASELAHVTWESLPPRGLAKLPTVAQRRLLAIVRLFRGSIPVRTRRLATFLYSQDRRIRELALDSLRREPVNLYQDALFHLLDDPAEELQLRAARRLTRISNAEIRRKLIKKAESLPERVKRTILVQFTARRVGDAMSLPAATREPAETGASDRPGRNPDQPTRSLGGEARIVEEYQFQQATPVFPTRSTPR